MLYLYITVGGLLVKLRVMRTLHTDVSPEERVMKIYELVEMGYLPVLSTGEWSWLLIAAFLTIFLIFKLVLFVTYKPTEEMSQTERWRVRLVVIAFFASLLVAFIPLAGLESVERASAATAEKTKLESEAKILAGYIQTGRIEVRMAWWTRTTKMMETGYTDFKEVIVGRTPQEALEYLSEHSEIFLPAICSAEGKPYTSIESWWKESGEKKLAGQYTPAFLSFK